MPVELFLALRYLGGLRRSQPFLSVIAAISVAGVAIGVAALLVVIGVMTGFDQDIQGKIIGNNPHLIVQADGGVLDAEFLIQRIRAGGGVVAAAPFVETKTLVQSGDRSDGVILRGIDPEREGRVTDLSRRLVAGSWPISGRAEIALGSELAAQLGARIGSRVEVVAGPRKKPVEMEVVGRFSTGMYEYDRHLAVAPIPAVQGLIGVQDVVSGIGVKLKDPLQADFLKHKIQAQLGYPYRVISWMDLNANLFAALKLEKAAMFVILTLIVLVACFNIIATLLMLVVQKIKEIGILKALGATSGVVRRIFTLLGLTIGGLGTGLGVGIGLTLCWALERYQFVKLPASVYYIDSLPVRLTASDAGIVVGSALAISWLACLYPAWLAARLTPTEAIRYE